MCSFIVDASTTNNVLMLHCRNALPHTAAVRAMPVPRLPFSDAELWPALNGALPAWLLLALAPRWRLTIPIATLTAAAYSLLYVGAMAGSISGGQRYAKLGGVVARCREPAPCLKQVAIQPCTLALYFRRHGLRGQHGGHVQL